MIYITDITIYQMSAPLRNGLIGSILGIGYNRMMLRRFMAMTIYIETSASKLKLWGNWIYHIIAKIIAAILHKKIHIIKMGINVLGASFLSSVIISWGELALKKLILYSIIGLNSNFSKNRYCSFWWATTPTRRFKNFWIWKKSPFIILFMPTPIADVLSLWNHLSTVGTSRLR